MSHQTQASIVALIFGFVLLMGGLFGVYYQGPFWASGVVAAMNADEVALALGLPAGVTLAGGFLIAYVILASPLTAHWLPRKRAIAFAVFALGVMVVCGIAAWLAGQAAAEKLKTTESPANRQRQLHGYSIGIAIALLLVLNGCVLPGPLHGVGGQAVEGMVVNGEGQGLPGQEIVLVQGHFDKLNRESVAYVEDIGGVNQVERAVVITDQQGHFSHKFTGFTHCHPTWIIPPLLTLPSRISGDTRHGSFFIIKTPGRHGRIYEVAVDKGEPVVRVFESKQGRTFKPRDLVEGEHIQVHCDTKPWIYANGYTGMVQCVQINITK